METENRFYVADWLIEPSLRLISRGKDSVHLEPKVMNLLVYMVQRPDQLYSRDELLSNVWQGMVVSDEALTTAIIKLRKAFNDDARHPHFIETVSKRGYRLIAEVRELDFADNTRNQQIIGHGKSEPDTTKTAAKISKLTSLTIPFILLLIASAMALSWVVLDKPESIEHAGLTLPAKPSIAVLPFNNMSNDKQQEYFSDGITEDLITDLSKVSGLMVIARNSTFTYKGKSPDARQVGKELGVRYVLEGSVRRAGQQVRIQCPAY